MRAYQEHVRACRIGLLEDIVRAKQQKEPVEVRVHNKKAATNHEHPRVQRADKHQPIYQQNPRVRCHLEGNLQNQPVEIHILDMMMMKYLTQYSMSLMYCTARNTAIVVILKIMP